MEIYLEEVIFKKVSHWLVSRNGPPRVEVEVEKVEPKDQDKGGQLGLVANRDEDHQQGSNEVLNDLQYKIKG